MFCLVTNVLARACLAKNWRKTTPPASALSNHFGPRKYRPHANHVQTRRDNRLSLTGKLTREQYNSTQTEVVKYYLGPPMQPLWMQEQHALQRRPSTRVHEEYLGTPISRLESVLGLNVAGTIKAVLSHPDPGHRHFLCSSALVAFPVCGKMA